MNQHSSGAAKPRLFPNAITSAREVRLLGADARFAQNDEPDVDLQADRQRLRDLRSGALFQREVNAAAQRELACERATSGGLVK